MTRRRELEQHLHALGEINEIMSHMKTLAMLEMRKLMRFASTQQRALESIEAAATDFCASYTIARLFPKFAKRAYLLIGSERGFCGDFNELLLERLSSHIEAQATPTPLLIAMGQKLCGKLEGDTRLIAKLDGPGTAEEVTEVLDELVTTLNALQKENGPFSLYAIHHNAELLRIEVKQIIPPFEELAPPLKRSAYPPLLNLLPQTFFRELLDHYLFAVLHDLCYSSLLAEARRRIDHLEGATRRIEQQITELELKRNALRQEEITEELEVIMLSAEGF